MVVTNPKNFAVVFDTRAYSGNFEREMFAFITGLVDSTGISARVAVKARERLRHFDWYSENTACERDSRDYLRPVTIWPTPGRFNDGCGSMFDDTPEVRATLRKWQAESTAPAYESVALFFEQLPPDEVLVEMVDRAQEYCRHHSIPYVGCRLLALGDSFRQVAVVADDGSRRAC